MSLNVSGSRSMYSVLMALQTSSPFSSAVLIWHKKYCEKYEGAKGKSARSGRSKSWWLTNAHDKPKVATRRVENTIRQRQPPSRL